MPIPTHRRPQSALTSATRYDLSTKQYRIPQPQTYNKLKHSINQTFSLNKSAAYTDIIQLTKSSNNMYHNKIDQLCSKYCIKPSPNKHNFLLNSTNDSTKMIDTDKIAKKFVRHKSHQKQTLQRKNYLNQEIKQQTSHVKVSSKKFKTQEFFRLTCENLKRLEKKHKQHKLNNNSQQKQQKNADNPKRRLSSTRSHSSRYSNTSNSKRKNRTSTDFHPYLKIYEQSQKQALQLILKSGTVNFNYDQNCPVQTQINEVQQWQKYQKNVKGIYSGIKRMRYAHSARQMAKSGRIRASSTKLKQRQNQDNFNGFYIT